MPIKPIARAQDAISMYFQAASSAPGVPCSRMNSAATSVVTSTASQRAARFTSSGTRSSMHARALVSARSSRRNILPLCSPSALTYQTMYRPTVP